MRRWIGWSLRILGVPLLPALCVAHGAFAVWVHEAMFDRPVLAALLSLIIYLLLAVVALMLGLVAIAFWVWDAEDSAGRVLFASMLLALGGLAAGYIGTLLTVESWELRWWGVETTCAVRHVETIGGGTPDGPAPVTHFYELECAAADAPDEMRTRSFVASGEGIPVVYDPDGNAGAQPKSHVDDSNRWAWGTGIAIAVWTVLTLAKVCLEFPARQRQDSRPYGPSGQHGEKSMK